MQARSIPPLPEHTDKKSVKRKGTKLIWILIALFIVILSVLFFRSSISKVTDVRIINNTYANVEDLMRISRVTEGESYFLISESDVNQRLKAEYPYIKHVTVEKHFPGQVNVYIQEYAAVAYELTADGQVLACLENGTEVLLSKDKKLVLEKPVLTQWIEPDAKKLKGDLGKQLAQIPNSLLADISEIRYYPSSSYPDRIKMYTRSGFEVVSTVGYLTDKITYLSGVVETQEPGRITMLDADSYISYTNLAKEENQLAVADEQDEDVEESDRDADHGVESEPDSEGSTDSVEPIE